ncbi:MAG TPA: beta-ketoacyl-ACP synthase III [Dehalococcoidia bacterium]|nr:beta-ketoacyl-ACP synthase III [Dehalococcoidia bacterium]
MPFAQITGWGMYVPPKVVTNDDLVASGLDTSDEWITSRTGIKQRHLIAQGEATSDLALRSARQALKIANTNPRDLDLIIVATCSPDHFLPSTASIVQDKLGATRAGAMDLNAACAGFVYGLILATGQIEARRCKRVLVVGADALSIYVNWNDRSTCVLFGDGAGAVVLETSDEPGVLATSMGSDGSGAKLLQVEAGGSRLPYSREGPGSNDHYLTMDGAQVFRFATQIMGKDAEKVIEGSNLESEDVDLFIPHQANQRIIDTAAKRLKLDPEKVFTNLDAYGNTSAASIPIAICEALEQERIKPGNHVVLTSFGAGLAWASAVIRWGQAQPASRSAVGRLTRGIEYRLSRLGSRLRRLSRKLPGSR